MSPADQQQPPIRHFLGLDLGQTSDPTAMAVVEATEAWDDEEGAWRPSYGVRHLRRWPLGTRYPSIVRDVTAMLESRHLRNPVLTLDRTGVGAPIADLFAEAGITARVWQAHITAGSMASFEQGVHYVPKKELVSTLQVLLQHQRLKVARLPERAVLEKELLNFRVKITTAANETFGAWREGQHDDLVLAVALACWTAETSKWGRSEELPPADTSRRPGPWN